MKELEDSFQQTLDNYRDPWLDTENDLNNELESAVATDARGFTVVAQATDIPQGTSRLFHLNDAPVAVFHGRDGSWVAAHGVCPHKSGPLVDSIYGNGRLFCPLHSYSFDVVSGACDNPEIGHVRIYETRIEDGQLLVSTGSLQ